LHPGLTRKDAERLVSNVPNRVVSGIKALVSAMNDNDCESTDALVADLREIIDDKDDGHLGTRRKEWGAFRRLDDAAAFIVKIDEAWKRADDEERREAQATEPKPSKRKEEAQREGAMNRQRHRGLPSKTL
jgi:hypothetical protein